MVYSASPCTVHPVHITIMHSRICEIHRFTMSINIGKCTSTRRKINQWLPLLHKLTKSINVEYNASRDKCPKNLLFSYPPLEKSIWSLPSSISPSSITNHHEMHPRASSGSTWATSPSVSPWSNSKDKLMKSLVAFIPTIKASSWSQRITWLATCYNSHSLDKKIHNKVYWSVLQCHTEAIYELSPSIAFGRFFFLNGSLY